uniref:HDC14484 n=1 Tax=Drosophila melanogaster TaxID=7227 RepID=Q6IJP6_DROME|nr:TPA_inf: HDC14484 [Drosophila melanogaster]
MHDPSDYDSVYSEEDFVDTVRGAATPPLMDYEEFRVKTMDIIPLNFFINFII